MNQNHIEDVWHYMQYSKFRLKFNGTAIISNDGVLIKADLPNITNKKHFAAMAATLMESINQMANSIEIESNAYSIIQIGHQEVVIFLINLKFYFLAILNENEQLNSKEISEIQNFFH